jgi:hypothetical protein
MVLRRINLAGFVVLLGAGSLLPGNTFATVTGVVSSRSGATLPHVAVEAIEAGSGYRYTGQSNDSGTYTLPDLREGTYRIHASHPGFVDWIAEGVELRPRDVRRVDITLAVPAVDAKVEVTGRAYLMEAERDGIGDSKSREYPQQYPATIRRLRDFVNEVGQTRIGDFSLAGYIDIRSRPWLKGMLR